MLGPAIFMHDLVVCRKPIITASGLTEAAEVLVRFH
jgi:hypothetical protein